jgi:rhodanese-related sulfurtransferase
MNKSTKLALLLSVSSVLGPNAATAATTGNRYGYPVLYQSDISSAEAWRLAKPGAKSNDRHRRPVIIDVRRVEEYVAGHPVGAISIPFPHVTKSPASANDNGSSSGYIGYDISVDPDVGFLANDGKDGTLPISDFVHYVESVVSDKETPIFLLCATGHRSVQAANALAKYGNYTHVRNIWEGYNGQPKYAYEGPKPKQVPSAADPSLLEFVQLDLNNDGKLDGLDRDGWAYFQALPTETKLKKKRLDFRFIDLYPLN